MFGKDVILYILFLLPKKLIMLYNTTMKNIYQLSKRQVIEQLNTSVGGLTSAEAESRLKTNGYNALDEGKKESKFLKFLSQFKDIMIIILLVASLVSIVVAIVEGTTSELVDGFIILAIVLLNAILGYIQENKAEKAMIALKSMTKPEAKVYRDGELIKIASKYLVVGDIVVLEAGDIVPADLRLLDSGNLFCDESSLTGESHQSEKSHQFVPEVELALGDRKNMLYSGNVITNGRAVGVVVAVGENTEIGKIATILATTKKEETPLQKNIRTVGKIITIIVLIVAAVTFVLELVLRPTEPIIEAFLIAVALAVAAIPESLPAVITIIMSMGVSKLAKKKAIIKRLHAVETLGCCEIICSDKTGTLTQNVMTVTSLYYGGQIQSCQNKATSDDFVALMKCMTLCNDSVENKSGYVGDPTETALTNFSKLCGYKKSEVEEKYKRVDELSFDSKRKLMTTINYDGKEYVSWTKGAIDNILNISSKALIDGKIVELCEEMKKQILLANDQMADKALRVLGFACKKQTKNYNKSKDDWENDLVFIGLVGMIDPPRKEVKKAVERCKNAGMRPIMITGDHKATAFAIAKDIGIAEHSNQVMLGLEIDKLDDEAFLEKLKTTCVFARVSPDNKVRIVEGFKSLGKIVAMTGDGVNDAPSLKSANIGVGMGITGTDVTKEVADMIVTDDNFATIVLAVEEGRKIYKNIQKTIKFLFSANIGEVLAIFFATLFFPEFIFLLPVQILFVNLITDSLPAIAMGFEPAEKDLMQHKPRASKKTIFADGVGFNIIVMGIVQTLLILGIYVIGIYIFKDDVVATTMAFLGLNFIQFFYLFSARVEGSAFACNPFKNKWQLLAIGVGLGIISIIAFTPLNSILGLVYLGYKEWLAVMGVSLLAFPLAEFFKFIGWQIGKK